MTKITVDIKNLWDKEATFELLRKEIDKTIEIKRERLKELLDLSISMGTLITLTDEQLRGFGKTTAIIEKSKVLGVPIVTSSKQYRDYLEAYSGLENIFYYGSADLSRGVRLPEGFIVDEGVNDEVIKELIRGGNKLVGGFKRL